MIILDANKPQYLSGEELAAKFNVCLAWSHPSCGHQTLQGNFRGLFSLLNNVTYGHEHYPVKRELT